MARRKRASKSEKIVFKILCIVLAAVLTFGVGIAIAFGVNVLRNYTIPPDKYVEYNGEILESGASLGQIPTGAKIKVFGFDEDYTYKITPYHTSENDFTYKLGNEEGHKWSDVRPNNNFTTCFKIERQVDGITLSFDNLNTILDKKGKITTEAGEESGTNAAENAPDMDIFKLTIYDGTEETVEVTFYLTVGAQSVTITPEGIVF